MKHVPQGFNIDTNWNIKFLAYRGIRKLPPGIATGLREAFVVFPKASLGAGRLFK